MTQPRIFEKNIANRVGIRETVSGKVAYKGRI
jgi:hypothetical protein